MGDKRSTGSGPSLARLIRASAHLGPKVSGAALERALYRVMVEQVPAVVYIEVPDEDHPNRYKSLWASPQIESWLGYTPEEWCAGFSAWQSAVHPDDRERMAEENERTNRTGEPYNVDYRLLKRSGELVWVHDEALPVHDDEGSLLYWQGLMLDVTERKKSEALEASLATERQVSDELRRLNDMKDTFLTAVSHDFRTPLTAAKGLAVTMARDEMGLSEEELRDFAVRIVSNLEKLERLVADLLDLDRLTRGTVGLDLQDRDIGAIAAEVVSEWNATSASDAATVLVQAEPVSLPVDRAKVERIIENLLANATRHTPAGTTIWVKVSARDHGALIAIEDEGSGIPDELKEAIFEPFRQGPILSATPGIGVGLSLVAKFVELHGGRVWVEDRAGGGASFRILLPAVDRG